MPANFSALGACITAADCSVFDVEYNPQGESSTNSRMWRKYERHGHYRVPCLASPRYVPCACRRLVPSAIQSDTIRHPIHHLNLPSATTIHHPIHHPIRHPPGHLSQV